MTNSTGLLSALLGRRSVLRSPGLGAALILSPKPALPRARREIELLQTFVAGTAYYDAERAHPALGVGQALVLRRQPDNRYDAKAIEVFADGMKLGYVPRDDNPVLAALMDDGRQVAARIASLRPDRFRDIGIAIALVETAGPP